MHKFAVAALATLEASKTCLLQIRNQLTNLPWHTPELARSQTTKRASIRRSETAAHKAETEPRFAEIKRGISDKEFWRAIELTRNAGLWRFDTRWRRVIPHGAPVWLAAYT